MNLRLRGIGASALALAALSAFAGPAAAAEFHSETKSTYSHGSQVTENVFTTSAGNVKCKTATFVGTGSGATKTTAQVSASYANCTGFGQAMTMSMNGCTFKSTAPTSTTGKSEIACPEGKVIQVDVPAGNCNLTIPSQIPGGSTVDFKNEGAGAKRDILVTSTTSEIKYTVDGPGAVCGTPGTYEGAKGASYAGTVTQKGFTNSTKSTQVGVWVE